MRPSLAVVAATPNEVLIAVMSALAGAIHEATDIDDFNSDEVRLAALRAYDGVVEAIRAQDADAAFRRMHRHVHAFRAQATSELGADGLPLDQATRRRPRNATGRGRGRRPAPPPGTTKNRRS